MGNSNNKPNKNWFSRRHESSEAQEDHWERWEAKRREKRGLAKENAEARAKRTPEQQWRILDARLGPGRGAQRERARLREQMAEGILVATSLSMD